MAQEVFHACLLDASKELDTAKETIYRAIAIAPPPKGWPGNKAKVGLA